MKKSLCLLLTILPLIAFCGDKKTLTGSWKEVSRTKGQKNRIGYTDTITIRFMTGNEYLWQKFGAMMQRGTYKIENGALDMGARYFTIVEQKPNRLVLRDDDGTYELVPYTEVIAGPGASAPAEVYAPVNSIQQMAGHWQKYKATSDRTVKAVDYGRQIKTIDIFPSAQNGKWGNVYAGNDAENAPSWVITSYSNQTLYCEGKDNRQFKVIKCQNNDFIMEGEGTTYFFRVFK